VALQRRTTRHAFEEDTMKTNYPLRSASALAGLSAAVVCSGIWLGLGLFIFAIQGGVVA
jgi:hypothetical protein